MLDIAQSEPALQRSFGNGEIRYGKDGLRGLFQQGCTKILLPKTYGALPQAVLVNTAGGLTGGDRLGFDCFLEAGASLCVTSQTAERVYRSCGGEAEVTNRLRLGENSSLEWLPQETILFDQSRLRRLLEVHMEENSRLLALESFVLGRRAMGETLANAQLSDQWRIWRGGKPVYADGLRLKGEVKKTLAQKCLFGGHAALASLLYVAPDAQDRLEQARKIVADRNFTGQNIEMAASAWNGILLVRFLAANAQELRWCLNEYLVDFRQQSLPRVWQI